MKPVDFRLRLLLAAVLPSLLMATLLGVFWWNWSEQTLESALKERIEATAKQLATAAELPLFSGDIRSLQAVVDGIGRGDTDLLGVSINDHRGGLLANHGASGLLAGGLPRTLIWSQEQDGKYWRLVLPVTPAPIDIDDMIRPDRVKPVESEPMGFVVMDVSLERLTRVRQNMLLLGTGVILGAILLSVTWMIWLARGVIRPLTRIIAGVQAMGRGKLDTRIDCAQHDVFQPLARVINNLAENVKLTQAEMQHRIEAATLELRAAKTRAEQEARQDALTGLYNRRAFLERAAEELQRSRRYGTPLALAMIDLDHFKKINDQWGHAIGDQVLITFAEVLKKSMRGVDIVARIGGEEFILLMTETPIEEAVRVAERIRKDIEAAELQLADTRLRWTASIGVTLLLNGDDSIGTALGRADKALYRAKDKGRNRVEAE